ncbi:MAG: hypothetical protein N3B21_01030 [Clostridia bacterium]|nr:hypothetical protein [Clostridia bacterium]
MTGKMVMGNKPNNGNKVEKAFGAFAIGCSVVGLVIGSIIIGIILIIIGIINANMPRNYYLKDINVSRATIVQREIDTDTNKYYVKLSEDSSSSPKVSFDSDDDRWVEVNFGFYSSHLPGGTVGVLLGHYDVFRDKLFSKGLKYQKSIWQIEEIYDSLESAQEANPKKKYNAEAELKNKKTLEDGSMYFVLESEGRTMKSKVSKELYDKYSVGQKVECEFEAIGDIVKLLSIVQ